MSYLVNHNGTEDWARLEHGATRDPFTGAAIFPSLPAARAFAREIAREAGRILGQEDLSDLPVQIIDAESGEIREQILSAHEPLTAPEVARIWRERHRPWASAQGAGQGADDYAYGVAEYRLGARKSLPSPAFYVGAPAQDKANRREIRRQVDAHHRGGPAMSASLPILDPRQKRNRPDWLIYVRKGSLIEVFRFASEEEARAFAYQINEGVK